PGAAGISVVAGVAGGEGRVRAASAGARPWHLVARGRRGATEDTGAAVADGRAVLRSGTRSVVAEVGRVVVGVVRGAAAVVALVALVLVEAERRERGAFLV